jgi:hypothetical protein
MWHPLAGDTDSLLPPVMQNSLVKSAGEVKIKRSEILTSALQKDGYEVRKLREKS